MKKNLRFYLVLFFACMQSLYAQGYQTGFPLYAYDNCEVKFIERVPQPTSDWIVIAGSFTNWINIPGNNPQASLSGSSKKSIFIAVLDGNMQVLFTRTISNSYDCILRALTVTEYQVFIAGSFKGNLDVGGTNIYSAYDGASFLARFDLTLLNTDLVRTWVPASDAERHQINDMYATDEDHVFITGEFIGTFDFNPMSGIHNLTSSGYMSGGSNNKEDIFLTKMNIFTYDYTRKFGSSNTDRPVSIECGGDKIYLAGYFKGTFPLGLVYPYNYTSAGDADIFLLQLEQSTGGLNYARFMGSSLMDLVSDLHVSPSGDIYMGGTYYNPFNVGPYILPHQGNGDAFIAKYTPAGNLAWAQPIRGTGSEGGGCMETDAYGFLHYAVFTNNGIYAPDAGGDSYYCTQDIILLKYDVTNGECVRTKNLTSTGTDMALDMEMNRQRTAFYIGGFFGASFYPDATNNYTLFYPNVHTKDGFLCKYVAFNFKSGEEENEEPALPETGSFTYTLYPNPAPGDMYIHLENAGLQHILVSDLQGRILWEDAHPGEQMVIPASRFSAGTYIVGLTFDNGQTRFEKVIVE